MHKEQQTSLQCIQQCKLTSEKPISLTELNHTEGISGTIMDQIVEYKCQEQARDDALCQWENAHQKQAINNYNNPVNMTAGILFKVQAFYLKWVIVASMEAPWQK